MSVPDIFLVLIACKVTHFFLKKVMFLRKMWEIRKKDMLFFVLG